MNPIYVRMKLKFQINLSINKNKYVTSQIIICDVTYLFQKIIVQYYYNN